MAFTLAHIQIGWISALSIEALLAEIMLDELIEQTIPLPPNDNNIYRYGRIKINGSDASHIVAIAQLPLSTTGKASAATVANNMRRTFPNLKFGIMVGIAGGIWTAEEDLRLGDIVVGVPDDGGPGIIQYDLGKSVQDGELVMKGNMNKAPDVLRSAAGALQRKHMRKPGDYVSSLEITEVKRHAPRPSVDNLFTKTYIHRGGESCEDCDKAYLLILPQRSDPSPKVHYGAIASGDQVVKDAVFADKIRAKHKIICFEMEAAGLDAFPCLVIRGISDYADTHKNDDWHAYAAASAAAYAKELLSVVPLTDVAELPHTGYFWGIFWIDADNKQSVEQGFAEIAKMQTPPLIDATSKGVLRWLANIKGSWLLILDNCDDSMMDFSAYMPSRGGSIILTTRLAECKILGTWANLDDLGRDAAMQLLLQACGYASGNQEAYVPAAEAVVSSLGQHALALVHAGAYIKKGLCTLDGYVLSFRKEQARLMKFKPQQQASRYGSVYATFEVSAEALASSEDHDCALALQLLDILAFLNREAVEEDIFSRACDQCHKLQKAWEKNGMQCPSCPSVSSMEYDRAYIRLRKPGEAMTHLAQARSQLEKFLANDTPPPWLAPAIGLIADIHFALGEFSVGATLLEKRVNLQSSYLRLDDNRRLSSLRKLAQVYTKLEDSRKLKQVMDLLEEVMNDGQKTIHTDFKDPKLTEKVLAYAQWNLAQARRTRQSVVGNKNQQSGQQEATRNPPASTVARAHTMPPQRCFSRAEVTDSHTNQSSRRAKEYKAVLGDRTRLRNSVVSSTPIPKTINPSTAGATGVPGYLRETAASRRARETRTQAKAEASRSSVSAPTSEYRLSRSKTA
ncbi:unnamed protein product [Aureobasidium mustum]|uniref:Purine and uridine phosphorylase n=1 Tax=Aureobasidium mustum TaxID=2773714 RepID=A0A9N8KBI6_9PEZI|nr:unnamed protein product [Aureobasidium mustum]